MNHPRRVGARALHTGIRATGPALERYIQGGDQMTLQEILDGLANLGRLRLEREQQKAFTQQVDTVGTGADNGGVLPLQGTTETPEKSDEHG